MVEVKASAKSEVEVRIKGNKELTLLQFKLKKDYANMMHKLKLDILNKQFKKETGIVSMKTLANSKGFSKDELLKMFKRAEKSFIK